jgi:uncharacterized protein
VKYAHIMGDMHGLLPRLAAKRLRRALDVFPVAIVTGARQTGKSTLVRQPELFGGREYITLDDVLERDIARRDPELLLERAPRLVIDEVQHAPDLLIAIKRSVDERRERGRYILTGSANLLLQRDVSESLAGRAGYVTLWPFSRREQLGFGTAGVWGDLLEQEPGRWPELLRTQAAPPEPWHALARRGGYPVPSYELAEEADRALWFDAYAATYLERDLRQLSAIDNLADMRRLMRALCLRLGGLLNQAELGRDLGLPSTTVQRYINLLEVSYQLVRVPAFSVNRTRRLMKSPKVYWGDTGLAMHLAGQTEPGGAHLENLVLCDLLVWSSDAPGRPSVLHWRTSSGLEVDFVVERGTRLLPVEIKAASRVRRDDGRGLRAFLDDYPEQAPGGLLLYDGDEVLFIAPGILAAPWYMVI